MNLLILDHRLPYLHSDADEFSMLTLPVGPRSLLDECLHQFSAGNGRTMNVSVAPNFSAGPAYARAILDATDRPVRIVSVDEAGATVSDNVAWDDIMVVDPRYLPTDGYANLPAMGGGHYRGATHVVAMGSDPAGTHESVECDTRGCVQRVQRLYLHMNWPTVATRTICCSRVPAQAIAGGRFRSLPELRSKLSDAGMLSRDLPLMSAVFDLRTEAGLLALCESLLRSAPHTPPAAGYEQRGAQVWLAPGSRVHPSARLVGPLVLHERVTVAEAATIVGPSVLGAGCRIGRGAIVAHSVLARNTVVAPGSAIRERFLAGRVPLEHAGSPAATGTCHSDLTLTVANSRRGRRSWVSSDMCAASRGVYQFAKRAVDIGLAVVGLLLLLPLLVVIAILIKLDARGPVLFAHGRERRGGKEFPCWKFR
ncbi:MAG TPA: sugar transferase, partial [Phycisphaerae bacterium]